MRTKILLTIFALFLLGLNSFASAVFDITKYGAKADGKTINTKAIQKAIDEAAKVGGTIYVPAGTFLTGTIFLKSNTILDLSPAAVIKGSPNIKDYIAMTWGHHEDRTPWHLVAAKGQKNITITGRGTIDGNGKAFWEKDRPHAWHFYKEIEQRPSPMVEIEDCHNVIIENVTIQNSAGWGLHPFNSRNVKIKGLTILNDPFGPNSDGIDVTGCQNVMISDCYINVGDDCIALKTTEDSGPCNDIVVTNCIMSTHCVAFRVGFESRKDFNRITFTNSTVLRASRIVDIRSIEGSVIDQVIITNITGEDNSGWPMNRVIEVDLNEIPNAYSVEIPEHPNYRKDKPLLQKGAIRNITFANLDIKTDGRIMLSSNIEDTPLENITFQNVRLNYQMIDPPGPLAQKAKSNGFFKFQPEVRTVESAFVFYHIKNLKVDGAEVNWPTYPVRKDWNLLNTEWTKLNPTIYEGKIDAIRAVKIIPAYSAIHGRKLQGATISTLGLTPSASSKKAVDVDCTDCLK